MLTNRRLIMVTDVRPVWGKAKPHPEPFYLATMKFYEDRPHTRAHGHVLDVFFADETVAITFTGKLPLMKFRSEFETAVTGVTASQRGARKVRGAVGAMDDALGIDTVGTVKELATASVSGSMLKGIGAAAASVLPDEVKSAARDVVRKGMDATGAADGFKSFRKSSLPVP